MTYRFSWPWYCYSLLIGLIACADGTYWTIVENLEYDSTSSLVLNGTVIWFRLFTWTLVLIQYFITRDKVGDIISGLYEINGRIDSVSYGRQFFFCTFFTTLLNALPTLDNFRIFDYGIYDTVLIIIQFLFINIPVVVAGQYSVLLNLLSDQMNSLTHQLRMSKYNDEVLKFVEIHHSLCGLATKINKTFNLLLFQTITLPFVIIVIDIYIVIVCIADVDYNFQEDELMLSIIEVLVNSSVIVVTVAAATRVRNEVSNLHVMLSVYIITC